MSTIETTFEVVLKQVQVNKLQDLREKLCHDIYNQDLLCADEEFSEMIMGLLNTMNLDNKANTISAVRYSMHSMDCFAANYDEVAADYDESAQAIFSLFKEIENL